MNTMSLLHFQDFYILEALRAGLSMAKSANKDNEFRRSFLKLENDVEEAFDALTHTMALHIAVYIWAAALGEARYAGDECETALEDLDDQSRNYVYSHALDYPMTPENVETLRGIFDQQWDSGSFGGRKWLEIVDGLDLYGKVSNATFIDHAVDLEHNGGNIFTKSTTKNIGMDPYGDYKYGYYNANDLRNFLNFKFAQDILQQQSYSISRIVLSAKVYNLVTRYSNIVTPVANLDGYMTVANEWLAPFSVEWGSEELTTTDGHGSRWTCEECGCKCDEYDVNEKDGWYYCNDCFNDKFTYCGKCEEYYDADEVIDTPSHPKYYHLCEECATNAGYAKCEECDEWTDEYIVTKDDGETLCSSCKEEHFCEVCNEYYSDILYHENQHETEEEDKPETTPLPIDGDGVFQIVDDWDTLPTEWEYRHDTLTFNKSGKMVSKIADYWTYAGNNFIVAVYDENRWFAMHTLTGLSVMMHKTQTMKQAKDVAKILATSPIDWNKISNNDDWFKTPQSVRDAMLEKINKVLA